MSGIDAFLEGATVVAPSKTSPAVEPTPEQPVETTEPSGVIELVLPTGIEVYYQENPKRLYRLRRHPDDVTEDTPEEEHAWRQVPSCSEITKILNAPGLAGWGEKVGINMVQELLRNGWVDVDFVKRHVADDPLRPWWGGKHLQEIGKTKRLTNWHMRDAAASRGTSVHRALESWAMTGVLTDPEIYPQNEQGYVIGLNRFLAESGFVPLKSEVIVGSLIHGMAGRFDMTGELPESVSLSTKLTTAGKEHRETVEADSFLVDLKTSSGVYDDHHLQVAGYQGLCEESGYERPNQTAILRVSGDGKYEFVQGNGEWLDFWFCKGLFDSLQAIKERRR